MRPVEEDEYRTTAMSPLRERRLLQMAKQPFRHKPFYSQYCYLQKRGLTGWQIGSAYILPAGEKRLAELIKQGV